MTDENKSIQEEDIDKLVEEELDKDVTQENKVDGEVVEQQLSEMGFLWKRVNDKLQQDGICVECKKSVDFGKEKVHVLETTNVQPGVVAFVAVCDACHLLIQDKMVKDEEVQKKVEDEKNGRKDGK